jgi:hypothetical protein
MYEYRDQSIHAARRAHVHIPYDPIPGPLPRPRAVAPPVAVTLSGEDGDGFDVWELPHPDYRKGLVTTPTLWLIVLHGGLMIPYGDVVGRYDRHLRDDHLRRTVFSDMGQMTDPRIDPEGYRKAKWYQDDAILTLDGIRAMEARRALALWPHGRSTGPTLSPSRA